MTHYVYVDWTTETTPRPFYVGQGDDNRVRCMQRNPKHTNMKNKYGINREIVLSTDSESDSLAVETQLIAEFHTFVDDPLASSIACNWTTGGEGASHSEVTKIQISEAVKNQWQDPEFRAARCSSMKGKLRSEITKKRLSEAGKGRKLSPESIAKRSESVRGSKRSAETKEKMREARRLWWAKRKEGSQ